MGGISVLFLMSILSFMFFTFIAIFLGIIVYLIITYIFESISIMCMNKNLQYKATFTAWIPFYNKYLLSKIVGSKILGLILVLCNIGTVCIGMYCYFRAEFNYIVFGMFLICIFLGFILDIVVSHKIYKNVTPKYGDILTVLNVLTFGIVRPIILFIIRNMVKKENDKD